MYKSPIEVFQTGIEYQLENDIMNMVQKYGITVDKDELLKALRYDRDQYDKGYVDGKRAAIEELVRCKDCKHWEEHGIDYLNKRPFGSCKCPYWEHPTEYFTMLDNDYCSYAKRREEDER